MANTGIGGHARPNKGNTDRWITPPDILRALGKFDFDPCADVEQPWRTADFMANIEQDGLSKPWFGRVWLNPPYSQVWTWMEKLASHRWGTALIFARTETRGFAQHVWKEATAMLFLSSRIRFHLPSGVIGTENAGGPSVLVAYGEQDAEVLRTCKLPGHYVSRWKSTAKPDSSSEEFVRLAIERYFRHLEDRDVPEDSFDQEQLSNAAVAYAMPRQERLRSDFRMPDGKPLPECWPFAGSQFVQNEDRARDIIESAAYLMAEYARLKALERSHVERY